VGGIKTFGIVVNSRASWRGEPAHALERAHGGVRRGGHRACLGFRASVRLPGDSQGFGLEFQGGGALGEIRLALFRCATV
tara:strand:- start:5661 stop:5900 length:240 start_codon:yes stop_codon:yes gene_type:complete